MTIRYQFRILSRRGLVVDRLLIQGRNRTHAEAKIRQMYTDCQILDCIEDAQPHRPGEMLTMGPSLAERRVSA